MDDLTSDLHTIAAECTAAGVPATLDPGAVLGLVTVHGVCALVRPPTGYDNVSHGLMFNLTVPVRLITHGPYDWDAVGRLHTALVAVWPVLRPIERTTPELEDAMDTDMPSLMVPAARQIDCPTTAPLLARAN